MSVVLHAPVGSPICADMGGVWGGHGDLPPQSDSTDDGGSVSSMSRGRYDGRRAVRSDKEA
jgi:hypothetical protein